MSKIIKNNKLDDVHSHNDKAYHFIDENLPTSYVDLVIEKMKPKTLKVPSKSMIRNVRNKTNFRNDILLALVEVAKENKENVELIKTLTA
jgi:hypothetical protein